MKKSIIIPGLLIGLLMTGSTVFAWPGGHGLRNCDNSNGRRGQEMTYEQHQERMGQRLERMSVILDLSAQQKQQLEDLYDKQWQEQQSRRAELQENRGDLREYQFGKDFNEAEFRAKAQKQADLKTEMMVQRAKTRQQALAILTPEQRQKAEKLWDMRGGGFFGQRGGMHRGFGPGQRGGMSMGMNYGPDRS